MKTLHKFAAVHGTVHHHFNLERRLISRDSTANDAQRPWLSGGWSWARVRLGLGSLRPSGDELPLD